jgi:hypothetical protein
MLTPPQSLLQKKNRRRRKEGGKRKRERGRKGKGGLGDFFIKGTGEGRWAEAPPPRVSPLNPRNFENFRPKTLRQLKPVISLQ